MDSWDTPMEKRARAGGGPNSQSFVILNEVKALGFLLPRCFALLSMTLL
jgi:hypothetical protein